MSDAYLKLRTESFIRLSKISVCYSHTYTLLHLLQIKFVVRLMVPTLFNAHRSGCRSLGMDVREANQYDILQRALCDIIERLLKFVQRRDNTLSHSRAYRTAQQRSCKSCVYIQGKVKRITHMNPMLHRH